MPDFIILPDGLGVATAWLIIAATMVTSLIGAAFGVGGGTVLLALLAVILPATAVVPVHGVVQLGSTAGRTFFFFRHVARSAMLPFVVGSAAGSALSGVLFVQLPSWLIQFAVALFVVWSVTGFVPSFDRRHVVLAGAFSGFLTILFGATGTFVSAFVKGMRLPRLGHVATQGAMMTVQHAIKVTVFAVLGFAYGAYAHLIAMMLVSGFVGTWVGKHLLLRMDERRFKLLLNGLLLLLAARLLWKAAEGYLAGSA